MRTFSFLLKSHMGCAETLLLFVAVSRAGYAHTHTRDMEDTPDAQQCVNSHLHKLVFTVKIRCPSPINRGHACSPRRIPGMALSHLQNEGSKEHRTRDWKELFTRLFCLRRAVE